MDKKSRKFADELKIKEEQLRLSLEAANAGIWVRDSIGEWKATPLLNTLFGRSKDDPPLLEEEFVDYIHPEDLPRIRKAYIHARNGESDYNQEYRVIWPDDSIHWLASKGKMVLENDKPRFIGITYEITEIKKAEESKQMDKERLEMAQIAAGAGLWDWNIKTGEIKWSPMMFKLFGLDPDENTASFKAWNKAMHPEDREIAHKRIDKAIDEHKLLNSEYRIVLPDDQIRWINALGKTEYDKEDNPKWMIGICIDITGRKEAELALKESEANYRNFFNNPLMGFASCEIITDENGEPIDFVYLQINNAFETYTGLKKEEVLNKKVTEVLEPEEVADIIKIYGKVALTGESIQFEYPIPSLNKYYEIAAFSPSKRKFIAFFTDISERKRMENELRQAHDNLEEQVERRTAELKEAYNSLQQSELKFKTLAENSPDIINRLDKEFKNIYINPVIINISGRPPEHFIGKKMDELGIPEEFTVPLIEKAKKVFETGMMDEFVTEMPTIKGLKTFYTYLAPEYDENGETNTVLSVSHDITELKQTEKQLKETIEELERSNKDLQSFAYITSHDLQEPLRTIGNYAGLMKRRYEGQLDSDADDFLNFMEGGAARMKDMVQGLLDYSRVGTQGGEFKEFNAEDALDIALINLKSSIEECHADVTHDPLPDIVADESQITRVFQNLIGNAMKFRKEGVPPKIHISAQKTDDECVFSVSDNGIGIEEQYSDRIFEVFKRLHAIGKHQGVGIGLAIVKRIIDIHSGRIWVESELGVGSTFYFTIPFLDK